MTLHRLLLAAIAIVPTIVPVTAHAEPLRMSKLVEFEYGTARVHAKEREALAAVAKECRANPAMQVTVEGHAGAYNEEDSIALGQHRADVVRSLLVKYGVSPDHITAIDYSREGDPGRYVDLVLEVR